MKPHNYQFLADQPPLSPREAEIYESLRQRAFALATPATRTKLANAGLLSYDAPPAPAENATGVTPPTAPAEKGEGYLPPFRQSRESDRYIRYVLSRVIGKSYRQAAIEQGLKWIELRMYGWKHPDFGMTFDFCERVALDIIVEKAKEALESMIDGDETAKSRNVHAVKFALERLDRDRFSDPRNERSPARGGQGGNITYNINFNGGALPSGAPNLCGECVADNGTNPIIDIK